MGVFYTNMKKIIIEVESEEENSLIETHVKDWVRENFQKYKDAIIKIENKKEEKWKTRKKNKRKKLKII